MQSAKEYITRPLEAAEVELIERAMQVLTQDYLLQRRLEKLYGQPNSARDSRTVVTNRWRLLTSLPQLGLQVSHALPLLSSPCACCCLGSLQGACAARTAESVQSCAADGNHRCWMHSEQDLFAALIASRWFCYPVWSLKACCILHSLLANVLRLLFERLHVLVTRLESMALLQCRTGQVLRQMYDEVVHTIPRTTHVGAPPGTRERPRALKPPSALPALPQQAWNRCYATFLPPLPCTLCKVQISFAAHLTHNSQQRQQRISSCANQWLPM